ncbi:MAG: preprotein translocase subunit YajC [Deltaproteobacteria bacterium]|nr:preprotein translocase subunit YajC [Deltaproteobacteria bacterium]
MTFLITGCPLPGGQEGAAGSPIAAIAPFILILILFYFLILRPQQKQGKERQEMLKNLKRGDNVITSGGIYGRVLNITGDIVTLEIAKGVSVRISRAGITSLASVDEEEKKVKEEKSEK